MRLLPGGARTGEPGVDIAEASVGHVPSAEKEVMSSRATARPGVLRCPGCRSVTGHFTVRVTRDTRQRAARKYGTIRGPDTPKGFRLRDGQPG